MTMVVSRKQRIHFRYEGERGAFLILHHGLLGSHEDWFAAGYVRELAKEFRVVIPDARGHGRSDKPAEREQYGQEQMAADLIEIMNELGIRNSHIVGYGLGALVGFELLRRFPERVRIAILGGESALMTAAVQDIYRAEAESLRPMALADYVKALKDQGRIVRHEAAIDEEQERPAALALMEAVSGWEPVPSERIQVASPLTLFAGTDDPAAGRVEAARSGVSRARLVHFPGFSHAGLFLDRTAMMEEILRLLKSGRRDEEGRRGEHGTPGPGSQRTEDRRRGPPGRRESPRQGPWSDRRAHDSTVPEAAAGAPQMDGPSPIPGAALATGAEPGPAATGAPEATVDSEHGPQPEPGPDARATAEDAVQSLSASETDPTHRGPADAEEDPSQSRTAVQSDDAHRGDFYRESANDAGSAVEQTPSPSAPGGSGPAKE